MFLFFIINKKYKEAILIFLIQLFYLINYYKNRETFQITRKNTMRLILFLKYIKRNDPNFRFESLLSNRQLMNYFNLPKTIVNIFVKYHIINSKRSFNQYSETRQRDYGDPVNTQTPPNTYLDSGSIDRGCDVYQILNESIIIEIDYQNNVAIVKNGKPEDEHGIYFMDWYNRTKNFPRVVNGNVIIRGFASSSDMNMPTEGLRDYLNQIEFTQHI